MAQLLGTWELVSCDDNFDKYMEAVGVDEEKRKLGKAALTTDAKVLQTISRDGNKWTIKITTKAGEKVDVYTEGTPTQTATLDGRQVSVVYSLKGDDLVETQTGDGFESMNVRKVSGDTMTMDIHMSSDRSA